MVLCIGHFRNGKPCKHNAKYGEFCGIHKLKEKKIELDKESKSILRKFFMSWRESIMSEKQLEELYDEFCLERDWAYKNNFESEYWCWNCKFGKDCRFH